MAMEEFWEEYNEKVKRIINSPIKEGTLVRFKSTEDLMALNTHIEIRFNKPQAERYANRIALITEVNSSGDFAVYFPDNGDTLAWAEADEFDVIEDLLKEYR